MHAPYSKAHIAAGLFAGIALGYVCSRHTGSHPPRRLLRPYASGDLAAIDVTQFLRATRRSWNIRTPGL